MSLTTPMWYVTILIVLTTAGTACTYYVHHTRQVPELRSKLPPQGGQLPRKSPERCAQGTRKQTSALCLLEIFASLAHNPRTPIQSVTVD